MSNFEQEVRDYAKTLTKFVIRHRLPPKWFAMPDHLATKASDRQDFEARVHGWRGLVLGREILGIDKQGRTLASAQLETPISVGEFGSVKWIEIMEPRPEKVGQDVVGLEHMEFYYPHFFEIRMVLNDGGVDFTEENNSEDGKQGHAWINIVLNEAGQELKLNDRPLAKIVAAERKAHELYII